MHHDHVMSIKKNFALFGGKSMAAMPIEDAAAGELFVEGWEFMQILGEGAYGE
jgi:hypothetical protein